MNCKNCQRNLRTDYTYCPDCGAKVIRNRITVKNLWYDAIERFFNIDNTFLRTFVSLFTEPDEVIGGYIKGVRKKFLNPISYFTIAVGLGGLFVFLIRSVFPEALDFSQSMMDSAAMENNPGAEIGKQLNDAIFEYQNLFYILMIPFLAIISRVVFYNKKEYNLSEHFVINIYGYAQMSICINVLYILFIWNSTILMILSIITAIGQIVYFTYVFKKLFNLTMEQMILKLLLFLGILGIGFIILTVGLSVYLFTQPEFIEQIKAASEAGKA